jgi:hypothetical protein
MLKAATPGGNHLSPRALEFLPCRSADDRRFYAALTQKYRSQMRFVRSQVLSLEDLGDSMREDTMNKKKSGVARFKRLVIKLTGCVGMGGLRKEILRSKCAANHIFARVEGVAQYG